MCVTKVSFLFFHFISAQTVCMSLGPTCSHTLALPKTIGIKASPHFHIVINVRMRVRDMKAQD